MCHEYESRMKHVTKERKSKKISLSDVYTVGHDTTASTISWVMYELARNPDHQQTCREEIEQFMNNKESGDVEW